ncbi:hypothetical protein K788_0008237 [Paraburkholderia caribensis MBA4]|uniref:Uncharacterized protein n=1 Tax=Paraburkholderia caribensis MBA4 TaxID=1323664 RepID=A0A0P0RF56_9BURK|nr:hypothetical protein K788_0008237 [Paraburkholderia caribensis MBA4]
MFELLHDRFNDCGCGETGCFRLALTARRAGTAARFSPSYADVSGPHSPIQNIACAALHDM